MIVNCDELVSLVHLPTPGVRSPKLVRHGKRTKVLPGIAQQEGGVVLGENTHAGKTRLASLSPDQRVQHMHVIGASGTGKSTLLLNIILQDIRAGHGIGVLDPHGDLIEKIIGHIPENRIPDVVLLDASDEDFPIGFNILSAHSRLEKTLLASDLVSVFRRQSTTWGDQMTGVLGNAILAFLESSRGGTLIDLRRFLVEKDFRSEFLPTVTDQEVVYFWKKEFPLLSGRPHVSLLTRLNTLLRPKPIRYMVGQPENRLDFADIMNSGKIFLAKLPQGEIGEENAYLLGALIVSKFQQLVIARQAMKDTLRRDFFLCLDECHQFLTPTMATILNGARKYRLGLLLAHQELHQLEKEPDVGSAVRANPYTRVCFRVGDQDAKKLEEGFSFFSAKDLQNLGRGEAICRVERSDYDFNLSVLPPTADENAETERIREKVIAASRARYATPRQEVEERFFKTEAYEAESEEKPSPPPPKPPVPKVSLPAIPNVDTTGPKMEISPPAPKPAERIPTPEPAEMGRGGREHRYVQHLIKQLAIGLNFEVEVEKQILDGAGAVDVLVKKGERLCAFEISVTTSAEKELQHIRNCFKAGFHEMIVVCLEPVKLSAIREAAMARLPEEMERIAFCLPADLSERLLALSARCKSTEAVSHGKRTTVTYEAVSPEEARLKRESLAQITAGSIRKLKGK